MSTADKNIYSNCQAIKTRFESGLESKMLQMLFYSQKF